MLMKWFLEQTDPPIERAVFSTQLCYFLGADAYFHPESNITEGFHYTAWRPLTQAMVDTLKEETEKWLALQRARRPPPPPPYANKNPGYNAGNYPSHTLPPSTTGPALDNSSYLYTTSSHQRAPTGNPDYIYTPEGRPYWHKRDSRYLTAEEIAEDTASSSDTPRMFQPAPAGPSGYPGGYIPPAPNPETVVSNPTEYWTVDPTTNRQVYVKDGKIVKWV